MSRRPPKELEHLLTALERGALSVVEAQQLAELLKNDADCRAYYIDYVAMNALLEYSFGALSEAATEEELLNRNSLVLEFLEQEERERLSQPKLDPELTGANRTATPNLSSPTDRSWSWQDVVPAPVAYLSVAVLLIFAALSFGPDTEQPTSSPVVASITGQRSAVWQTESNTTSPRIGDELQAGRRLTLNRGVAEITTARGAVALLEAPCIVEMLENDNALYLHDGKLVGICLTDSSRGFLVRTPHMDVVDLGTKFGVDTSKDVSTEVHVYQGEVEATRQSNDGWQAFRETLVEGQAMRATNDSREQVNLFEADPLRFASIETNRGNYLEVGTGHGRKVGDYDPHWRVVALDGKPVTSGGQLVVAPKGEGPTASNPNEGIPSQWLKVDTQIAPPAPLARTYTCRTTFQSPDKQSLQDAKLTMGINGGRAILTVRVNDQAFEIPQAAKDRKTFGSPYFELDISDALSPNENTVEIEVYDTDPQTAFRVGFEIVKQ